MMHWRGRFGLWVFLALAVTSFAAGPQVIYQAQWGEDEKAVGLKDVPEDMRVGPVSFSVFHGELVLNDFVNKRLLRHTFARREGRGYAIEPAEKQQTKVIAQDIQADQVAAIGSRVYIHRDGEILRLNKEGGIENLVFPVPKSQLAEPLVAGYGVEFVPYASYERRLRLLDQNEVVVQDAIGRCDHVGPRIACRIKRMPGNEVRLIAVDDRGKIVTSIPIEIEDGEIGAVLFKGEDHDGRLYVEVERIVDGEALLEVRGYTKEGQLIQRVEMQNDYYTTVLRKTDIDLYGNIYQMRTTKGGVEVLRFENEEVAE